MLLLYHCYIQDFHQRLFQEKLLWISTFLKLECLGPARLTGSSEKGRGSPKAKSESEAALVSSPNASPEHSLPSSSPVSADQREFRAEDGRRDRAGSVDVAGALGKLGRAHASAAGDRSALLTASSCRLLLFLLLLFLPLTTENSAASATPTPIHTSSLKLRSVASSTIRPRCYPKRPADKGPPLQWGGRDLTLLPPQTGRCNTMCVCMCVCEAVPAPGTTASAQPTHLLIPQAWSPHQGPDALCQRLPRDLG